VGFRIPPMSATLFFDPTCKQPYDSRTLLQEAMGGTEATVTRVADALDALVVQHNRTETYGRYRVPEKTPGIGSVVINRDSRALARVHELYPNARVFLWLHDQFRPGSKRAGWLSSTADLMRELGVTIVCVSDTQRHGVEAALRTMRIGNLQTQTIYNPIDDALAPDGSGIDPTKLVFFSSPNKGLKFTLDAFRAMRRQMPDLRLVVGNPGYKVRKSVLIEGVEYLGPQPQARMLAEVRTALCTFFPNFVIPETFGLVFAESNAVGTPVLTHDCGAAVEVLGDRSQILPVTAGDRMYETLLHNVSPGWRATPARLAESLGMFDVYAERIRAWRNGGRPNVGPDPRFRLATVAQQWRALLAG
jgi:glycosyltransferase involved in cell wall biosynthesis